MPVKNLIITQGDTFEWLIPVNDVNGNPLDMSGYTGGTAGARGGIYRKSSDAAPVKPFAVTILDKSGVLAAIAADLFRATDAEIAALSADNTGKRYLLVRLTATETKAVAVGGYMYKIEIEDTLGFVWKPYKGQVTVD